MIAASRVQDHEGELAELMEWMQQIEENGDDVDPLLALADQAQTQATPNPTQASQHVSIFQVSVSLIVAILSQ